ncbi:LCP family protein [Clostridium sp. UBA1056]|uniref:LCP family protein n=1 Tax=unclassified Clostridium TaxID=2614128 RepID=UPI003216577B
MSKNKINSNRKKKPLGFKISMTILGILIFIFAIGAGYAYSLFNKMDNVKLDKSDLGIAPKEEFKDYENHESIKNIALFGIDAEEGQAGRSDSIMIATIDPIHNKVKITSIMRDSYVNIPDHGMDKINHAYAFGGPTLAIRTLNENFGLNIENFVSVNFSSLPQIIDTLGGITINITDEEISHIPGVSSAGPTLLNGEQALAYSRIRYASGGDYERTHRHRNVMSAVFKKALEASPTSYPSILNNILPLVQTNLSSGDFISLATKVASMGNGTLEQERFPRDGDAQGDSSSGVYYLKFDIETVKKQMKDYIFDDKK